MLLAFPASASAALIRFSTGRVLSVESVTLSGDTATIVLRDGGQVQLPRAAIAEILPDEYDHTPPRPPEAGVAAVVPEATGLRALVDRLAAEHGVDVKLADAVVQVESNYDTRAVSPKGAMGLMQIMPAVAQDYAVDDPFDPEKNLNAGLSYLSGLLSRFDVRTALAAYNAGPATVAKFGGMPPYRETQDYVQRVMAIARRP